MSILLPKDSPIQLPAWHCSAQHWLCQPGWTTSLLLCLPYIPFAQSLYLYLWFALRLPRHVTPSRSVSLQQAFTPPSSLRIVMLCVCVCVFVSWMLRGSFRLIKEMIYRSMMLEEFPDLPSNRVFSNEFSPLNHSQPQSRLAPKKHAILIHARTNTHIHLSLHILQYIHTAEKCRWVNALICLSHWVKMSIPDDIMITLVFLDFTWSHKGWQMPLVVLLFTLHLPVKIFSSMHCLIKIWKETTRHESDT